MKYIRYTSLKIREIKPNSCYGGGVICDLRQREKCEKHKMCQQQLCSNDERKLANVSLFIIDYDEKIRNKIEKAVVIWRKAIFKKCKRIEIIIRG